MAKRTHRIVYTLMALAAGILLVFLLTYAGKQAKGPLGNLLSQAGDAVTRAENQLIIQSRSERRIDHLSWAKEFQTNPGALINSGVVNFGAYDNLAKESYESIINLEDSLNLHFPFIHIYTAWGSKAEEEFPVTQVQAIHSMGSIPVITWEPWLSDFDAEKFPGLRSPEKRDKGGLADIARGLYDAYILEWAAQAKKQGKTILVRMGHEMNDPYRYPWGPHNNKPAEFVAAWKHVHQLFTRQGADNVLWIWSPHPSYGYFQYFYPGDDYVDYVGLNILNYGNVAHWSQWWTFDQIFGAHYKEFEAFGKPMMLTEFGSLAVGGDRTKWYADALASVPVKYPLIRAILFFHFNQDNTTTEQAVDWTIIHDPAVMAAIRREVRQWPAEMKPPVPENPFKTMEFKSPPLR